MKKKKKKKNESQINVGEPANAEKPTSGSPSQILTLFHDQLHDFQDELAKCRAVTNKRESCSVGEMLRCNIILTAVSANTISEIQSKLGIGSHNTVLKCLRRFLGIEDANVRGYAAIKNEKPRSGRPSKMTIEVVARLNSLVRNGPEASATMLQAMGQCSEELYDKLNHIKVWDFGLLGQCLNVSDETVRRYCAKTKLRIHAHGSLCFSHDPQYEDKVMQVHDTYTSEIGSRTKVLCLDEKTCIQALMYVRYRIYSGEMYKSCRYKRLGCVHLITAFDQRTGHVYHDFLDIKTRYGIRAFIEQLPTKQPELRGCFLKIVLDNLAAHKNFGQDWYDRHPNIDFIFTPTCASWINQVESFFGLVSRYVLAGRSVDSRDQLALDITNFLDYYNTVLKKPFKGDFNLAHHFDQRLLNLKSFTTMGFEKANAAYVASYRRVVGLHDSDAPVNEVYIGVLQKEVTHAPMEVLL